MYHSNDQSIHVLLGPDGNQTLDYPHVHVIHDEPGSEIRMHITRAKNQRDNHVVLPGNASGNAVIAVMSAVPEIAISFQPGASAAATWRRKARPCSSCATA